MSNEGELCRYEDLSELAKIEPTEQFVLEDFAPKFVAAFRIACIDALKEMAGRKLVVFHSAGYDSRVLGLCADDLLPDDAVWVCIAPEHQEFLAIAERFYRPRRHILAARPSRNGWVHALEFTMAETGWRKDEIVTLQAGYFNEIFDCHKPGKPDIGWHPDGQRCGIVEWAQFYHHFKYAKVVGAYGVPAYYPILHRAPLEVLLGTQVELSKNLRKSVLQYVAPELFAMPRGPV